MSTPDAGPMKPLCTGTSTTTGEPCRRHPIKNGTVCPSHGGRAPQVKEAARRRGLQADAEKAAAALLRLDEGTPVADPIAELRKAAAAHRRLLEVLAAKVDGVLDDTGELTPVVQLWRQSSQDFVRVLWVLGKLGVDSELVANVAVTAEWQLTMSAVLLALEPYPDARDAVRAALLERSALPA